MESFVNEGDAEFGRLPNLTVARRCTTLVCLYRQASFSSGKVRFLAPFVRKWRRAGIGRLGGHAGRAHHNRLGSAHTLSYRIWSTYGAQ